MMTLLKKGVKLISMKKLLLPLLLFLGLMDIVSAEPKIKETNFVNVNHEEAVKYFNELYSMIEKDKKAIEEFGGISGKQLYCKGINSERYGYYFAGDNWMLKYRFVPDPERGYVEVGSRNIIHLALEIGEGEFSADTKEINLQIEKVNRETLDFYQVLNPLEGYNYKKVGKCEIFEGDMYLKFKGHSDHYGKYLNKQKKEQEEKNQL